MFCSKNAERSLAFVVSVPTDTALRPEDDEDAGIYEDDENIKYLDFFRYTTRKRYVWEDWTDPTTEPTDYRDTPNKDIWLYFLIVISVFGFVVFLVVFCLKYACGYDCCSAESGYDCCSAESGYDCCSVESDSYSSADRFTTMYSPPHRSMNFSTNVHRPPTGWNQFSGTTEERGRAVSFINSTYSSSSIVGREPGNAPTTVAERPPDYSTVTLTDLVNPARPTFPLVMNDHETPPPEYGKENPLFK